MVNNQEKEKEMDVESTSSTLANSEDEQAIGVAEEVTETVGDKQKPVSRSRSFIMAKYPDKTYDDDDLYEEDLANHLEQTDKDLQSYREADAQLEEIITLNPELALIVEDLKKGMPLSVALARNVDLEEIAPIEGEEDYEEYQKSIGERKAKIQADKEREDMLRTNAEKSAEEILDYLDNKGWTDERKADFDEWFNNLVTRLSENRLGKAEMEIFVKGYEFDEAVARAEEKGKVSGRNEKIETKRKRNENVDGLPEAGASASAPSSAPRQRQVIDIDRLLGKK